jgi:hypothetical protein
VRTWEITDPDAAFRIFSVKVSAADLDEALIVAMMAMMGKAAKLDDAQYHATLIRLEVEEIDPRS